MYAVEGYIPSKAQKMQMGNLEEAEEQKIQKLKLNILQSLDAQLEEKERKVKGGTSNLTSPCKVKCRKPFTLCVLSSI